MLLICLPAKIQAQDFFYTVRGFLQNEAGQPIPNANIQIEDILGAFAQSDETGAFSLLITSAEVKDKESLTLIIRIAGSDPGTRQTIAYSLALDESIPRTLTLFVGEAEIGEAETSPQAQNNLLRLREVVVSQDDRLRAKEKKSLATTLLSQKDLESLQIKQAQDLSAISPNFIVLDAETTFALYFSVRGMSSLNTFDPIVAIYIDDVAQFQSYNAPLDFLNLQSIEFLKGPQLTLYGRNAMGGILSLRTKKPPNRFSISGSADVGFPKINGSFMPSLLTHNYSLNMSFPLLIDKAYMQAQAYYSSSDGIYTNVVAGAYEGGKTVANGALAFNVALSQNLSLSLSGRYDYSKTEPYPYAPSPSYAEEKPFQTEHNRQNLSKRNSGSAVVKFNYTHPLFNLLSVSSYENFNNDTGLDADFSSTNFTYVQVNIANNLFTEEFRLSSTALSESFFSWSLGSYFYYQTLNSEAILSVLIINPSYSKFVLTEEKAWGLAFFWSFLIPLNDWFSITSGWRLDIDSKKTTIDFFTLTPSGKSGRDSLVEKPVSITPSPRLVFSFTPFQDATLFLSTARGFRSGGLNRFTTRKEFISYKPEYTWQTELGLNASLGSANISFSLFYIYWRQQQVNIVFPSGEPAVEFGIINAEKSKSYGFEAEFSKALPLGFTPQFSVGLVEAYFTSFDKVQDAAGNTSNLHGKRQPFTPQSTARIGLQHSYTLKRKKIQFSHTNRLDWNYFSGIYYNAENTSEFYEGGYGLLNFSSSFDINQVTLTFWVKNLLDRRFIAFLLPFGNLRNASSATQSGLIDIPLDPTKLGQPLSLGLKVSFAY